MSRRKKIATAAVGALAALLVYLLTAPPSLTWAHHGADGGDLATAVVRHRLPHPPGFPVYLLLGDLFARLPWGDPARRLGSMSAVAAAAAVGLLSLAGWRLVGDNPRPVFFASLALAFAPLFWSQALIVEVYALAAFFAALVMWLVLQRGPDWAVGLAWGLGMGVHPTLLFLAPLALWRSERPLRRLVVVVLSALVGWGMAYGPLLLVWGSNPSPWGSVSTPGGWWDVVSGRMYHGYLFALPGAAWPRRLLAAAGLLARQFTPLGAAAAAGGWLLLWRERRSLAVTSGLAAGLFILYAIGYNTTDSLVYLVPSLPLAALWLAVGGEWAAAWADKKLRGAGWLLLLLPLLQLLFFWPAVDLHGDREALCWAQEQLRSAPPQAIVLSGQDAHTAALWYVHDVLAERPDVVVVDRHLWGRAAYQALVAGDLGLAVQERSLQAACALTGRPVVSLADE
ncbi:MAG: DUF2723 domain-containing protein [Anaerolineae bacterium]|nr:DUF2723 domain-containing protein [Anaerolineae bacterium]